MENLKSLSLEILVDRLAFYTKEHIRLMRDDKHSREYEECKNILKKISAEIILRKEKLTDSPIPGVS